MINDQRTITERPHMYVIVTDSFMSGWGDAKGRSLYALAINTGDHPDVVMGNAESRPEMKRPRLVLRTKANGTPDIKLRASDHLSIVDRGSAPNWYRPGGVS